MKLTHWTFLFMFIMTSLVSGFGCREKPDKSKSKVIVLGLDGLTWDIILPLINQGELPGFNLLIQKGSWGNLETIQPTESVSIWTSIATGVSPQKHDIQTFTRRIPGTDTRIPIPGVERRAFALWDIASQAGLKVVCAKWFATWPAEPLNGVMLSPRLEPDTSGFQTYPIEVFSEIDSFRYKSTLHEIPTPPKTPVNISSSNTSAPGMLIGQNKVAHKMFDDTSTWLAARHIYNRVSPDLFMVYLKSVDRVQHFLWGAHKDVFEAKASEKTKAEAEAIFAWYRYFDGIILKLLKESNTILFVISDHGFQSSEDVIEPIGIREIKLDRILQKLGYQAVNEKEETIWDQTQAYVAKESPFDWTYHINLNKAGREPEGIVRPEQSEHILNRLRDDFLNMKTQDGRTLFLGTKTSAEADLLFKLNPELSLNDHITISDNSIAIKSLLPEKMHPRGIHVDAPPGIIAVAGKPIRQAFRISRAHIYDITPTVAYLLNLPVASDLDGTILKSIIDKQFFSTNPVKLIDSYGIRSVQGNLKQSDSDKDMIEELKALGYL